MELSVVAGILGVAVVFSLLAMGVHIAISMGVIGLLGCWYFTGSGITGFLQNIPLNSTSNFLLMAIPLFVLMGHFVERAGITRDLYEGMASLVVGRIRGGLGMATIVGCAAFAAVSGSSYATVATLGSIAVPEMRRHGYLPRVAAGCVAAGGTLGILIPPSILLIIYGWMCEVSVTKLFLAGVFPGLISAGARMLILGLHPKRYLEDERLVSGKEMPLTEKFRHLYSGILPVIVLFGVIMGGIYTGLFTPTEAAAVALVVAFIIAGLKRTITGSVINESLLRAGGTTAMIFAIIMGSTFLVSFLALSGVPVFISEWVVGLQFNRYVIIIFIILMYLVLGMFLESISMLLLTLAIVYPVVSGLGFDGVWFGIIMCKCVEVGLITPPLGLNAYVLSGVVPDIPLHEVFRGIFPYLMGEAVVIALLVAFPQITLFLPNLIG
jgi:tripartite ATP-independent transporter DctM subunit